MKHLIEQFNKAFESRVRLGIMSMLMVQEQVEFNTLKETLELTDGNLASHLRALEELEFIKVHKQFVGRKPKTSYQTTRQGRKAFGEHLNALETLIKNQNKQL